MTATKMICGYCDKRYEIVSSGKINIECSLCGCKSVRFNKNVKLVCEACGTVYNVKKGETTNTLHKSRCYCKVFDIYVEDGNESTS